MDPRIESTGENPVRRRATYQDVLDAPEDQIAELIDGDLVLSPRPAKAHSLTHTQLTGILNQPFGRGVGGPGGWLILMEPEIHFDEDILVPDLAGWRKERAEQIDETAFFTTSPDWVCEILSRSTAARDRSDKLEIYARAQVQHVWLVDPILHTLEVYAWSERGWVTLKIWRGSEKVRAVPFDAIDLDLAALWS